MSEAHVRAEYERILPRSTPCELWTGPVNNMGYGTTTHEGRSVLAHRLAYMQQVGPIPEGLVLDHLCKTPLCTNVKHLEPVTQRENLLRGDGWPAVNARKTACVRGHPYDDTNTYHQKNRPGRRCKRCNADRQIRLRAARRG